MAEEKVSLCVLRLELSDGDALAALNFGSKESSPESGSSEKRRISGDEIRRHRGERKSRQITVESYDLNSDEEKEDVMSGPDGDSARVSSKAAPGTTKRPFFSGNPFVEVTEGILHLYKEDKTTPGPSTSSTAPSTYAAAAASSSAFSACPGRSEMICMLAVPAVLTSHDLLNFIAPCAPDIRHVRIVRDRTPNQYMVLLKFRTQDGADDFYRTFNGMPFNSLEPDLCHLVYVSRVETVKESEGGGLPIGAHTELPTCPVCLERMDESVDGVLTILCNHSFHGACLSKWGDASCPVCRFTSTPELVEQSRCFTCNSTSDLWICLICGNVGCGRYDNKHAEAHYSETQHIYAMQLGTNRVWDYAGDNFVHRLVQNKADGKLVELDGQGAGERTARDWSKAPDNDQEKLESVQLEYSYLLTSQLESQRHYFEAKLAKSEEQSRKETLEIKERAQRMAEENSHLKSQLASLRAEKKQQEKKTQQLNQKLNKLQQDLADEKEMNSCLRDDKKALAASVEKLKEDAKRRDGEIKELQEQLRDIFFHLEAQRKVEDAEPETKNELLGGQIVLPADGATGGGSSQGKGRRKRSTKNN